MEGIFKQKIGQALVKLSVCILLTCTESSLS